MAFNPQRGPSKRHNERREQEAGWRDRYVFKLENYMTRGERKMKRRSQGT
jgi:hypothetical protein